MIGIEIIESISKCDRGIKRPYQEDSVRMSSFSHSYDGSSGKCVRSGWLLTVADGMGGHEAGDVASKMALNSFYKRVMDFSADLDLNTPDDFKRALEIAYSEANSLVYSEGGNGTRHMGTTLVLAFIVDNELFMGNVGDSRGYLISNDNILRATKDDSYVQELVDSGEITEEEAGVHPRKNEITNAIGIFPPDAFKCVVKYIGKVQDYDYILLCTDGLHGVVKDNEIVSIIKQFELNPDKMNIANKLIQLALKRGGPDNTTLILAKIYGK